MNAKCKKCNTYHSVRQNRGTRLKDLRCRKDGGELELISSSSIAVWKDKNDHHYDCDLPTISGQTVLRAVANEG